MASERVPRVGASNTPKVPVTAPNADPVQGTHPMEDLSYPPAGIRNPANPAPLRSSTAVAAGRPGWAAAVGHVGTWVGHSVRPGNLDGFLLPYHGLLATRFGRA
jgi:hypothetical protein